MATPTREFEWYTDATAAPPLAGELARGFVGGTIIGDETPDYLHQVAGDWISWLADVWGTGRTNTFEGESGSDVTILAPSGQEVRIAADADAGISGSIQVGLYLSSLSASDVNRFEVGLISSRQSANFTGLVQLAGVPASESPVSSGVAGTCGMPRVLDFHITGSSGTYNTEIVPDALSSTKTMIASIMVVKEVAAGTGTDNIIVGVSDTSAGGIAQFAVFDLSSAAVGDVFVKPNTTFGSPTREVGYDGSGRVLGAETRASGPKSGLREIQVNPNGTNTECRVFITVVDV